MDVRIRVAWAACVIALLAGCGKSNGGQHGPPPLAVEVAPAQRQDIATYSTLDGQIVPLQQATLSTQQSGTVAAVYVNVGQRVIAGQLLAKLDDSALRAQLAGAIASADAAQAKYRSGRIAQPIQSQGYSSALTSAQQSVDQASARTAADVASLKNAQLVYTSNAQLYAKGYVSETALEQSRSQFVAAQQQLASDRAALASARAALASARANTGQTQVDSANVASARAAYEQAEANVTLLRTQVNQSSLYAPFAGVVTQRLVDPGAFAGPSQPLVQLSQIDSVYVNVNVPDDQLAYVHQGTDVTFTTPSLPGRTFSGTIFNVNATPTNGTLSYLAQIKKANPDATLRGGMLVTVNVRKAFHAGAIVVPRTAVAESDRGATVFTVADGKAVAVPVRVGLQTDTLSEVSSPQIKPGTTVITTRPDALQNGSVVAINGVPPGAAK